MLAIVLNLAAIHAKKSKKPINFRSKISAPFADDFISKWSAYFCKST